MNTCVLTYLLEYNGVGNVNGCENAKYHRDNDSRHKFGVEVVVRIASVHRHMAVLIRNCCGTASAEGRRGGSR
jgi:hypothetical protein